MARFILGLALGILLGGCANLAYYAQAVGGHFEVMRSAQPIPRLLVDPKVDTGLKAKLEQVAAIREFASRELALPDNGSYRSYADLGRPYVVWNVFAAKEFSVEPEAWCMLFVGCVNYRGYYRREDAEQFARELQRRGLETYVASIPAYSTLGFFDDPVLNTFLRFGEAEVARVIFHELAHQVVFVRGDSTFNESFATAVENEGMGRWLARYGTPDERLEFLARQARKADFQRLVSDYRERLKDLYGQPLDDREKRRRKAETLAELRQAYAALKAGWGGRSGYDSFFDQDLNNARLASVSLYTKLVPAFEALLAGDDHDLPRFYEDAKTLASLGKKERQAELQRAAGVAAPR